MRIFVDANILFSAAKSDGAVRRLLALLVEPRHQCRADAYVVEEARRNLVAKAPERVRELDAVLANIQVAGAHRGEASRASQALPEKDRPVLEAAMHLACDALVTGDRTHFGMFYGKTLGGVTIHSPSSLARVLAL